MDQNLKDYLTEELGKRRSAIIGRRAAHETSFAELADDREIELEERAQEDRIAAVLDSLEDRDQEQLREIESALERLAAGDFACDNCQRPIEEERLRADPTVRLCAECASRSENSLAPDEAEQTPDSAPLPPDLDILDDDELRDRLFELIREDGQVDTEEMQISTRNGVVFLEGAVPSETEHEILLNILTDVAGVREIKDNLEIQRLAWEREDRFKEEAADEVQPGTIPKGEEPYSGTEDPVLADEEGVDYEPPVNQPPPIRKG